MYEHRYLATTCPECGADLTKPGMVRLYVSINGETLSHLTQLSPNGILEDVDHLIEHGYHSDTECNGCGHGMCEEEDADHQPPAPPIPRVLIVVEGGVVQCVISDAPVQFQVKDWDVIVGDPGQANAVGMDNFGMPDLVCDTEEGFKAEVMNGMDKYTTPDKEETHG